MMPSGRDKLFRVLVNVERLGKAMNGSVLVMTLVLVIIPLVVGGGVVTGAVELSWEQLIMRIDTDRQVIAASRKNVRHVQWAR